MKVQIYLDNKPDKQGKVILYFYLVGSNTRLKISSGIRLHPDHWKNGSITAKEPNHDLSNTMLQAKLSRLNRIITELKLKNKPITPATVRDMFRQEAQVKAGPDKGTLVTDYMELLKVQNPASKKATTLRSVRQVIDHIKAFDPKITLEELSQNWVSAYCKYLSGLGLEDSTIKFRHLKEIKFTIKEATKNGIKVNPQVDKVRWTAVSKQPFFATWEEVEAIAGIKEFVKPIQARIRDLFILSCYTGLRNSDWKEINQGNILEQAGQKMLRISMQKTGFDYAIPIHPVVLDILVRYGYQVPQVSQQEFNREIKKIAGMVVEGSATKVKYHTKERSTEQVKRSRLFSSHTGRRTFGRRYLDKGGSLVILSKLFGHHSTETTLKYLAYQPQEVISEFIRVFS